MYTLIGTAKLNDVDPQAWLADVLARIADILKSRLHEFCPGSGSACAKWPKPPEPRYSADG